MDNYDPNMNETPYLRHSSLWITFPQARFTIVSYRTKLYVQKTRTFTRFLACFLIECSPLEPNVRLFLDFGLFLFASQKQANFQKNSKKIKVFFCMFFNMFRSFFIEFDMTNCKFPY